MLGEHRRAKPVKLSSDPIPASAGGLNKTSMLFYNVPEMLDYAEEMT
jgi:hypothetical protein